MMEFFDKLQEKYNYDEKQLKAIKKIVPAMIDYYGEKYSSIILDFMMRTKIINCSSEETISMVEAKVRNLKYNDTKGLLKEPESIRSAKYVSEPQVYFDTLLNNYVITGVNRFIILAHTYNLDSAKGLASLTKELCRGVKSYYLEYQLDNNKIVHRVGIKKELLEVSGQDHVSLTLMGEKNTGCEEGLIAYDVEAIVGMILNDKYENFDYNTIKRVAYTLNDDLGLQDIIKESEFEKSYHLEVEFDKVEGMWNHFNTLVDFAAELENKLSSPGLVKVERDELVNKEKDIVLKINSLIDEYRDRNKVINEKS